MKESTLFPGRHVPVSRRVITAADIDYHAWWDPETGELKQVFMLDDPQLNPHLRLEIGADI